MYTKDYCPYCDRAKALLARKGQSVQEIKLNTHSEEFFELAQKTGMRTVPQIFINEEFIGGYSELAALDQAGKLDDKLND